MKLSKKDIPNHPFVKLSLRQFEILKKMYDEDEELVGSGLQWWCDYERTNWRVVKILLTYCLISGWKFSLANKESQYLHINDSGKKYLNNEKLLYQVNDKNSKLIMVDRIPITFIL